MDSKFQTDELNACVCGFKPTHYSVAYGRTPYDVFCPNCKKQTTMAKCKITGHSSHVIDYWNKHISKLTKEELQHEVKTFLKEMTFLSSFSKVSNKRPISIIKEIHNAL